MRAPAAAAALLLVFGALAPAPGCGRPADASSGIVLTLDVAPTPPVEGELRVEVTAKDAEGRPVTAGTVELEGNMSHPGMKPSLASAREEAPGVYRGTLELTMPGDWLLEARLALPDGREARATIPLNGVRPR